MGSAIPFVLLHHLAVLGLFLRTLFRSQQAHHIATCLDGRHPQPDLQIFTLFQLGFDHGEIGLLIIGQCFQLAFRDLDIGFGLDTRLVKIELDIFQFGDLIGGEPDIFFVFQ